MALSEVARVSTREVSEADSALLTDLEVSFFFPDLGILGAGGLSAQQVRKVHALTVEDNPILAIEPTERMPLRNSRRIVQTGNPR
jgi:hypothetical protein